MARNWDLSWADFGWGHLPFHPLERRNMKLQYESISKQPDGLTDISVIVIDKKCKRSYTYTVKNQNIVQDFLYLHRTRKYGQALNLLKKMNLKGG